MAYGVNVRAAIYNRKSVDQQGTSRSTEDQDAENRAVCEREGWEIVGSFTDNNRGATRYAKGQREAWSQVIDGIKSGAFDVLVTWECSRAQRDLGAYVKLRDLCEKHNIMWCYKGRTYDLSRTDDRFNSGLDALLGEREGSEIRDRILRSTQATAVRGLPHGRKPFGYRREYDPVTKAFVRQVPDEVQAPIVQEAARRFAAGETAHRIAKDFMDRRLPTPIGGVWDSSRVKRVITNPTYIGMRTHRGQVIGPAVWPAIIDEALFQRCVARFNEPERRKFEATAGRKYLLTGIARCGVCDGRTVFRAPRGYPAYTCRESFCISRKMAWVDDAVERLVIERLSQPDAAQLFIVEDADNSAVLDELAEQRARLQNFYDSAADGEITPAALSRIEARIGAHIADLEAKLRRIDVPAAVKELAGDPAARWGKLTLDEKREAVRFLLDIRILPTQVGRRSFDPDSIEVRWRTVGEVRPPARRSRAARQRSDA